MKKLVLTVALLWIWLTVAQYYPDQYRPWWSRSFLGLIAVRRVQSLLGRQIVWRPWKLFDIQTGGDRI